MIVLMAGLPGTGKTTLARELASRTGGCVINKDEIRHALFAADEIEYSSRQDDFCLQIMLETAGYLLQRNPKRVIFLDGRPFSRRYQIDNVLSAATRAASELADSGMCMLRRSSGETATKAGCNSPGRKPRLSALSPPAIFARSYSVAEDHH